MEPADVGQPEPGEPGRPKPEPGPKATPDELFAALRQECAGLEEVCRWQWNLIQRMHSLLRRLPTNWPGGGHAHH